MIAMDIVKFAAANLWKMKLRTCLTVAGVTVGIAALGCLIAFGSGMQKNVTDQFKKLDLFSSIIVDTERTKMDAGKNKLLDDSEMQAIRRISGVSVVFPEIRIAAQIHWGEKSEMRFIRVIPAEVSRSSFISLKYGRSFAFDGEQAVIVDAELLRRLGVNDPRSMLGRVIGIRTVGLDLSKVDSLNPIAGFNSGQMPLADEIHRLPIIGITENSAFGGGPMQAGLFIPPVPAQKMRRLPFSSPWELFSMKKGKLGYSSLTVRVSHPRYIEPVTREIRKQGFRAFALLDQFKEMRTAFFVMDMVLFAIGMVAIFVAALGIINTMVMSILERYNEIGVMKAVGAGDGEIMTIFFFESGLIGLIGGISGLLLGMGVSEMINRIVNYYLAKQGIPFIRYFHFSLALCLGAAAFSLLVSLAAAIYPALRAARVDPVKALRHE